MNPQWDGNYGRSRGSRGRGRGWRPGIYNENSRFGGPILNFDRRGGRGRPFPNPSEYMDRLVRNYRDGYRGPPNNYSQLFSSHLNDLPPWYQTESRALLPLPLVLPVRRPFLSPPPPQEPVRPSSPLPGSEEYMQRDISEKSALLKRQLDLEEPHCSDFNNVNNNNNNTISTSDFVSDNQIDNFDDELFLVNTSLQTQSPRIVQNVQRSKRQPKKQKQVLTVEEIHDKIITHISNLSYIQKMNLVNQAGPSGYDLAVQQITKQKRLELSKALRDMCNNKFRETNNTSERINAIIPEFEIKIEELPRELVEQLSSTLNEDVKERVQTMCIDPEVMFQQAADMLNITGGDFEPKDEETFGTDFKLFSAPEISKNIPEDATADSKILHMEKQNENNTKPPANSLNIFTKTTSTPVNFNNAPHSSTPPNFNVPPRLKFSSPPLYGTAPTIAADSSQLLDTSVFTESNLTSSNALNNNSVRLQSDETDPTAFKASRKSQYYSPDINPFSNDNSNSQTMRIFNPPNQSLTEDCLQPTNRCDNSFHLTRETREYFDLNAADNISIPSAKTPFNFISTPERIPQLLITTDTALLPSNSTVLKAPAQKKAVIHSDITIVPSKTNVLEDPKKTVESNSIIQHNTLADKLRNLNFVVNKGNKDSVENFEEEKSKVSVLPIIKNESLISTKSESEDINLTNINVVQKDTNEIPCDVEAKQIKSCPQEKSKQKTTTWTKNDEEKINVEVENEKQVESVDKVESTVAKQESELPDLSHNCSNAENKDKISKHEPTTSEHYKSKNRRDKRSNTARHYQEEEGPLQKEHQNKSKPSYNESVEYSRSERSKLERSRYDMYYSPQYEEDGNKKYFEKAWSDDRDDRCGWLDSDRSFRKYQSDKFRSSDSEHSETRRFSKYHSERKAREDKRSSKRYPHDPYGFRWEYPDYKDSYHSQQKYSSYDYYRREESPSYNSEEYQQEISHHNKKYKNTHERSRKRSKRHKRKKAKSTESYSTTNKYLGYADFDDKSHQKKPLDKTFSSSSDVEANRKIKSEPVSPGGSRKVSPLRLKLVKKSSSRQKDSPPPLKKSDSNLTCNKPTEKSDVINKPCPVTQPTEELPPEPQEILKNTSTILTVDNPSKEDKVENNKEFVKKLPDLNNVLPTKKSSGDSKNIRRIEKRNRSKLKLKIRRDHENERNHECKDQKYTRSWKSPGEKKFMVEQTEKNNGEELDYEFSGEGKSIVSMENDSDKSGVIEEVNEEKATHCELAEEMPKPQMVLEEQSVSQTDTEPLILQSNVTEKRDNTKPLGKNEENSTPVLLKKINDSKNTKKTTGIRIESPVEKPAKLSVERKKDSEDVSKSSIGTKPTKNEKINSTGEKSTKTNIKTEELKDPKSEHYAPNEEPTQPEDIQSTELNTPINRNLKGPTSYCPTEIQDSRVNKDELEVLHSAEVSSTSDTGTKCATFQASSNSKSLEDSISLHGSSQNRVSLPDLPIDDLTSTPKDSERKMLVTTYTQTQTDLSSGHHKKVDTRKDHKKDNSQKTKKIKNNSTQTATTSINSYTQTANSKSRSVQVQCEERDRTVPKRNALIQTDAVFVMDSAIDLEPSENVDKSSRKILKAVRRKKAIDQMFDLDKQIEKLTKLRQNLYQQLSVDSDSSESGDTNEKNSSKNKKAKVTSSQTTSEYTKPTKINRPTTSKVSTNKHPEKHKNVHHEISARVRLNKRKHMPEKTEFTENTQGDFDGKHSNKLPTQNSAMNPKEKLKINDEIASDVAIEKTISNVREASFEALSKPERSSDDHRDASLRDPETKLLGYKDATLHSEGRDENNSQTPVAIVTDDSLLTQKEQPELSEEIGSANKSTRSKQKKLPDDIPQSKPGTIRRSQRNSVSESKIAEDLPIGLSDDRKTKIEEPTDKYIKTKPSKEGRKVKEVLKIKIKLPIHDLKRESEESPVVSDSIQSIKRHRKHSVELPDNNDVKTDELVQTIEQVATGHCSSSDDNADNKFYTSDRKLSSHESRSHRKSKKSSKSGSKGSRSSRESRKSTSVLCDDPEFLSSVLLPNLKHVTDTEKTKNDSTSKSEAAMIKRPKSNDKSETRKTHRINEMKANYKRRKSAISKPVKSVSENIETNNTIIHNYNLNTTVVNITRYSLSQLEEMRENMGQKSNVKIILEPCNLSDEKAVAAETATQIVPVNSPETVIGSQNEENNITANNSNVTAPNLSETLAETIIITDDEFPLMPLSNDETLTDNASGHLETSEDKFEVFVIENSCGENNPNSTALPDEVPCLEVESLDSKESDCEVETAISDNSEAYVMDFNGFTGAILVIKVIERTAVAASDKGKIFCFDMLNGKLLNSIQMSKLAITSMIVIQKVDTNLVYVGSLDSTLGILNFDTQEVTNHVKIPEPVQCMEYAWNNVYIGSDRGSLIRYDLSTGRVDDAIKISDSNVLVMKGTLEGPRKVLVIATRNAPVCIRDANTGLLLRTMETPFSPTVYSLLFEKNLIFCGTSQHDILVYTFEDGQLIFKHEATTSKGVVCMQIVGDLLFAGCYNGNIYVYNTKTNIHLGTMNGPGGLLLSMEIIHNKIIVGTKSSNFRAWKIPQKYIDQM